MGLKEFLRKPDTKDIGLIAFAGLAVAYVRQGLEHHWKLWDSFGDFLVWWFIHTMGVVLLMVASAAAIIRSHEFFLGYSEKEYGRELMFYIVMTILVAAVGIAVVAHWPASDDDFSLAVVTWVA